MSDQVTVAATLIKQYPGCPSLGHGRIRYLMMSAENPITLTLRVGVDGCGPSDDDIPQVGLSGL